MDEDLTGIAQRQFGVLSRDQALAAGLSRDAIRWRLKRGLWERACFGIYRVAGAPRSWRQDAAAASLLVGREGALSHRAAAYLYRLDGLSEHPPSPIDVTIRRDEHLAAPLVTVHRAAHPIPAVWVSGLRVTSLARTLVDLAGKLTEAQLEIALDSAQRRFPRVGQWLERHLGQVSPQAGRTAVLRRLLEVRSGDRPTDSLLEVKVRRALRASGLARPIAGLDVYDEDGFVMRVDFAWPDHLVALHVDGFRWHDQRVRFERDARQRTRLAGLGWMSLAVTHRSLSEPEWLRALGATLRAREPQCTLPF